MKSFCRYPPFLCKPSRCQGGKFPLLLDLYGFFLVLIIFTSLNHKSLSEVVCHNFYEVLLLISVHNLNQMRENHFVYTFMVKSFLSNMSWKKASADIGLAGLTPHEAARGAMYVKEFQNILDPFGEVMKEVKASTPMYYNH